MPLPLNLVRTTPATAWAIPEPPPPPKRMKADAKPAFEVATIKPSNPDQRGKGITVRGNRILTINTSASDIMTFAYGIHRRQIVNAPAWFETEKFDITGEPDTEGLPNDAQIKGMIQKLLADRFHLQFHREKRELPAYAITVAKTGAKLTKSAGDPNGLPGLGFRALGNLVVNNATMTDFAGLLQGAVLDRPVVDQTGLQGRFDFTLLWTPDQSQFASMGTPVPAPATDDPNAPPDLFTATVQQLGLRLESTKAPVEVFAIDTIEKPTAN
jgi:uncharacterized protein (TIGR03435 family)